MGIKKLEDSVLDFLKEQEVNRQSNWRRIKKKKRVPYDKTFQPTAAELKIYLGEFEKRGGKITTLPPSDIRLDEFITSEDHFDYKENWGGKRR
jgi:hypothetical protein